MRRTLADLLLIGLLPVTCVMADFRLTVLHTNDVHARFDGASKYGGPCRPSDVIAGNCYGGVARRMTALRHFRNATSHVLLLDAGDQFQGTLWFSKYKGLAAAHFMNLLHYDAMTLGNHELDNGVSGVVPFLDEANFPVLCCNVDTSQEPELGRRIKPYVVLTIGEKRIGIIGYITRETKELSNSGKLIFLDEIESVREQVRLLRTSGVNIIIALGHAGYDLDLRLASEVADLDLVIGGHTDTFLYTGVPPSNDRPVDLYPREVLGRSGHGVLVVQAYAFGKYLGHLDLAFNDAGEIVRYSGNPILMDNSIEKDEAIADEVSSWRKPVEALFNRHVGSTEVFLDGEKSSCRLQECTMGDLVTNAMLYYFTHFHEDSPAPHAAIINSGAVRASLEQGNITLADLQMVQPFRNTFEVIELEGRHIRLILEHSVAGYDVTRKHGRFLQVAGLKILYDLSRPVGEKVKNVCIQSEGGSGHFEVLKDDRVYRLVVTSFLLRGGDGFTMIKEAALKIEKYDFLDLLVTVDYIERHSPLSIALQHRIAFSDGDVTWRCEPLSLGDTYSEGSDLLSKSSPTSMVGAMVIGVMLYT